MLCLSIETGSRKVFGRKNRTHKMSADSPLKNKREEKKRDPVDKETGRY
jgi:hypothetical protein